MELVQFFAHGLACGAWVLFVLQGANDSEWSRVSAAAATALSCIAWGTP